MTPAGSVHSRGDLWRLLVEVTLHKLYRQAAHHRAQRRSVAREVRIDDSAISAGVPTGAEPTPDEALAAAEELEAVLAQLSEHARQALELRLQGYEHAEIAERLACSERTVRRCLAEARRVVPRDRRSWVPAFRFASAGMTRGVWSAQAERRPPPVVN